MICVGFCAVLFTMVGLRAVEWQPIASAISVAWASIWLAITLRQFRIADDAQSTRFLVGTMIGGMVGVLVQAIVAGPAMGVAWLLLGVVGIGGGFGIGAASIVFLWYGFVTLARTLLSWRVA
jgi:hypothetical protein